jgi:predicted alpha/beta-hydrolase family hydrolase
MTDYEYDAPKRGSKKSDRAVLLAHGAGADMHSANLVAFSRALAAAGIPALRFNFAYKSAGRSSPPKAETLQNELRDARAELARRTKLPLDRLVVGGRSMGGRVASYVATDDGALGLLLLGYPLHAPGRPQQQRVEHFPKLSMPVLFVSGTRDSFGTPDELTSAARAIKGRVAWHWIETGDHSFRPLKKQTGLSIDDALALAAPVVVDWVREL